MRNALTWWVGCCSEPGYAVVNARKMYPLAVGWVIKVRSSNILIPIDPRQKVPPLQPVLTPLKTVCGRSDHVVWVPNCDLNPAPRIGVSSRLFRDVARYRSLRRKKMS
jgi:hypothetical protein